MEIHIREYISGARESEGVTVIIDVFRAFSTACYAFDRGIRRLLDVASPGDAMKLRGSLPSPVVLAGETEEKKPTGFDFGNSPTEILTADLSGKTMIHSTTAGTNGILNAVRATEVLGAGLVNAKAVADYILRTSPPVVSLVAMGYRAAETADEDVLCAEYIKRCLLGEDPDIGNELTKLMEGSGKRFFLPENLEFSPPSDFFLCTDLNRFNFVLKAIVNSREYAEIVKIEL